MHFTGLKKELRSIMQAVHDEATLAMRTYAVPQNLVNQLSDVEAAKICYFGFFSGRGFDLDEDAAWTTFGLQSSACCIFPYLFPFGFRLPRGSVMRSGTRRYS